MLITSQINFPSLIIQYSISNRLLYCYLKELLERFFISLGISRHIFGPVKEMVDLPFSVLAEVWTKFDLVEVLVQ